MEWSRCFADWPNSLLWRNTAREPGCSYHLTAVTHFHSACLTRNMLNLFFIFFPFFSLHCSAAEFCLLLKLGQNVYLGRCKNCFYLLCLPSVLSVQNLYICMEPVAQFSVVLLHSHLVPLQETGFISSRAELCTPIDGIIPALQKLKQIDVWLHVQACMCKPQSDT